MKQYLTGFFPAFCLSISLFLFLGYNRKMDGEINIKNNMGYNIVTIGAHHGDGFGGDGVFSINNEHGGEYGWSVIGRVSPDHYK
tara:strand:+ start:786 stop:1037 length:252 start_codon:yes stop_codon:yes gene_type:complete